uniref:Uncharacterized protein n=1 Tax=Aquila chrysaetos chrysaetos TaxID=223781 RepID=A0A663EF92_AQUCH
MLHGLAGSSSEPSWQSVSPSQAQRCGMQWPFWHWKLEASQVCGTRRVGPRCRAPPLPPPAPGLHATTTSDRPVRPGQEIAGGPCSSRNGRSPRSPWVTPRSFPLRAVLAHEPAVPQGWLLEASKLSQSQEPLSL